MKVSFCEHNIASGKLRDKLLKEYPQIESSVNKCIGECACCGYKPIVRVDGKYIESETEEELYETIIKMYL